MAGSTTLRVQPVRCCSAQKKAPKRLFVKPGCPLRRVPLGVVLGLFLAVTIRLADFTRALLEVALQFLGLVTRGLANCLVNLALDLFSDFTWSLFMFGSLRLQCRREFAPVLSNSNGCARLRTALLRQQKIFCSRP
jgi:hypothetical protein